MTWLLHRWIHSSNVYLNGPINNLKVEKKEEEDDDDDDNNDDKDNNKFW